MQAEAPVLLSVPAAHVQHEVAPTKSENLPAGQALQSLPPLLPKLPAAHFDGGGAVKFFVVLPLLIAAPPHANATTQDEPASDQL